MNDERLVSYPRKLVCVVALLLPVIMAGSKAHAASLVIDPATTHQEIDGFGTCLAWWVNGDYLTNSWQNLYYQDLGASILRIDIHTNSLRGPDDNPATPVTLTEDLDANIAMFDFSETGVRNFGAVAEASNSKALDDVIITGSVWSPPHWMKGPRVVWHSDEHDTDADGNLIYPYMNGSNAADGSIIDTPENLRQFGLYLASYIKGFEQTYNVTIHSISIQNELIFAQPYGSCVYSYPRYVKTVKAVKQVFADHNITTKIVGPEDVGVGTLNNPWIAWRQMEFVKALRADQEAFDAVDIYAIHGYALDGVGANRSPEMWAQYWDGRSAPDYPDPSWTGIKNDGKKSWMTETSGEAADWDGAILMGLGMLDHLVYSHMSAYIYWQFGDGGNYSQYTLTNGTSTNTEKYVVAKHFFRYIRPGSQRVEMTGIDPYDVLGAAFVHPDNNTLTVVVINPSTAQDTVDIDLGGLSVSSFDTAFMSQDTNRMNDISPVAVNSGSVSITMPAESVITLQGTITGSTPTAWETWVSSNNLTGTDAEQLSDPDGDSVNNLVEFAFNLDPNTPGSTVLPASGTSGLPHFSVNEQGVMSVVYLERQNAGVTYVIEESSDLATWQDAAVVQAASPEAINADWQRVSYNMSEGVSSGQSKFYRLKVTEAGQ